MVKAGGCRIAAKNQMALSTGAKTLINACLSRAQLKLETTTADYDRHRRLVRLEEAGHFTQPAFPTPRVFDSLSYRYVLEALHQHRARLTCLATPGGNDVGYTFDNEYFSSPDAEVLYCVARSHKPRTVLEIGSGNSTRLIRQAIIDSKGSTKLVSIDPCPRTDITGLSDEIHRKPVQDLGADELAGMLKSGDILFIDSSHVASTASDVVFLYLSLIPRLTAGVLIHVHDIWLPYDYPRQWAEDWQWNEQYLVQAMLSFGCQFEVLWAGHYLERALPDFDTYFPYKRHQPALSLWMRKLRGPQSDLAEGSTTS